MQDEQQGIHETLAMILFLGNLSFDAVYSDVDPAQISSPPAMLKRAAELMGVDEAPLRDALLYSVQVTRGETIKKPYTCTQAADVRDAFAKATYGRLFGWIVSQVNELLAPGAAFGLESEDSGKLYDIGGPTAVDTFYDILMDALTFHAYTELQYEPEESADHDLAHDAV